MKICFPVQNDKGIDSLVYSHFGSAPAFVIVDTESQSVKSLSNGDRHHEHGACNPVMALNNEQVDAIVVGGIGGGALNKLNQKGIKVFRAQQPTINENVALFSAGALLEFTLQHTCSGHAGCSH
jgi:predicted Fe-Mo cluster-binding NifX family protein